MRLPSAPLQHRQSKVIWCELETLRWRAIVRSLTANRQYPSIIDHQQMRLPVDADSPRLAGLAFSEACNLRSFV